MQVDFLPSGEATTCCCFFCWERRLRAAAGLLVSKVESSDSIRETGFKIIISKMSKPFFQSQDSSEVG